MGIQKEHRLVKAHHAHKKIHGDGRLGRFNTKLAVTVTNSVGTVWCAYIFALISLVSLPQAIRSFGDGDTFTGISWLSQSFLQLVLLPIIMVGQRVISESQDQRAEADHEILNVLHEINLRQLAILELMASVKKERE